VGVEDRRGVGSEVVHFPPLNFYAIDSEAFTHVYFYRF
jgi:hypothetical protein